MAAGFNLIPAVEAALALGMLEAGLAGMIIGGFLGVIAGNIHRRHAGDTLAGDELIKAEFARVSIKVANETALKEARAILEVNGAYGTRFYRQASEPFEKLTVS